MKGLFGSIDAFMSSADQEECAALAKYIVRAHVDKFGTQAVALTLAECLDGDAVRDHLLTSSSTSGREFSSTQYHAQAHQARTRRLSSSDSHPDPGDRSAPPLAPIAGLHQLLESLEGEHRELEARVRAQEIQNRVLDRALESAGKEFSRIGMEADRLSRQTATTLHEVVQLEEALEDARAMRDEAYRTYQVAVQSWGHIQAAAVAAKGVRTNMDKAMASIPCLQRAHASSIAALSDLRNAMTSVRQALHVHHHTAKVVNNCGTGQR
jgi:hypothetical protein